MHDFKNYKQATHTSTIDKRVDNTYCINNYRMPWLNYQHMNNTWLGKHMPHGQRPRAETIY